MVGSVGLPICILDPCNSLCSSAVPPCGESLSPRRQGLLQCSGCILGPKLKSTVLEGVLAGWISPIYSGNPFLVSPRAGLLKSLLCRSHLSVLMLAVFSDCFAHSQACSALIPACNPDHGLGDSSVAGFRGKNVLCVSSKHLSSETCRLHSYLDTDLGYKHFHVYIGLYMCAGRYTCMYMCVKALPNSWLFYMWPLFCGHVYTYAFSCVYQTTYVCRYACMHICM